MVVAAFDGACAERDYDLLCFAGGSLHSLAGYELQRNRCFELASAQSLDAMVGLCAELEAAQHDSVTAIRDRLLSSVRAFLSVQKDDIALLVARHRRPAA